VLIRFLLHYAAHAWECHVYIGRTMQRLFAHE
jgi:hypothetical protein